MLLHRRLLLSLALAGALAACSTTPAPTTAPLASPQPPKLVVLVVIDGLPMRQVTGYRDQLAPDGFARFLDHGRWFSDAHYGHGHTVTAAGHSVMLSGAYPHRSGIISNEWRDPATGEPVYNTGDAAYHYIDNPTAPLAGTSPRNLKVETLGDVLRIGERQFLAVSRDAIVTLAGTEGVLSFSPTVSRGACATTEPLSKDEYDFAATRIFPGEAVEPFGAKCP